MWIRRDSGKWGFAFCANRSTFYLHSIHWNWLSKNEPSTDPDLNWKFKLSIHLWILYGIEFRFRMTNVYFLWINHSVVNTIQELFNEKIKKILKIGLVHKLNKWLVWETAYWVRSVSAFNKRFRLSPSYWFLFASGIKFWLMVWMRIGIF